MTGPQDTTEVSGGDAGRPQLEMYLPPEKWETGPPAPGSLLNAHRIGDFGRLRPAITVDLAELSETGTVVDAADALLRVMRRIDPDATFQRFDNAAEGGHVVQWVRLTSNAQAEPLELVQVQTLIDLRTLDGARKWALTVVLTAEPDRLDEVTGDFQEVLDSIAITQDGAEA